MAAMGGHGPYVWSAYLITLIVLGAELVQPLMALAQSGPQSEARRPAPGGV